MRKNNKGFTLVELVVSVALLALILVPVAGFFTNSFKIQSKNSMKTSATRAGQYIIENFKNKNYLSSGSEVLKNDEDFLFEDFVKSIELSVDGDTGLYKFSDSNITKTRSWNINYKNVDYKVDITIGGFNTSDISNLDIPNKEECNAYIEINSDGSFSFLRGANVETCEVGASFDDPIPEPDKTYTANYPTIILYNGYANSSEDATLWIKNNDYCEKNGDGTFKKQKEIRIVKELTNNLNVYIEGTNLSILKGQEGDGATSAQTRITSSYVGEEIEGNNKRSSSELILDATMVITKLNDDTVRDTLSFSFPVNYDYSKEGV